VVYSSRRPILNDEGQVTQRAILALVRETDVMNSKENPPVTRIALTAPPGGLRYVDPDAIVYLGRVELRKHESIWYSIGDKNGA